MRDISFISGQRLFTIFFPGDVHFDNPHCDRELYFRHMDQAKSEGAAVVYVGDFFCLMEGKGDRRHSKSNIRQEYNNSRYIDSVINDAAVKHMPYAKNIGCFFEGNHESAIRRHLETDPLERLAENLNLRTEQHIPKMGYQGFIRVRLRDRNGTMSIVKNIAVHHGKWGGVVTKGVLAVARYGSMYPDAHVVVSGHTHDQWVVPDRVWRLKNNGDASLDYVMHLKVPTYKEEFIDGKGYGTEKIVKPKPLGGYFLDFYYERKTRDIRFDTRMAL